MTTANNPAVETVRLPMLALRGLTAFPEMLIHFDIGRERSIQALKAAMEGDQTIFLVTQRDLMDDDPGPQELYTMGTIAHVRQMLKLPGGNVRVLVEGVERARIVHICQSSPFYMAEAALTPTTFSLRGRKRQEALVRAAQELFEDYAVLAPKLTHEIVLGVLSAKDAGYLADYLAQNLPLPVEQKQKILEERRAAPRLERMLEILTKEIDLLGLESEIHERVRERLGETQREYYLREQLKQIRQELGEGSETEDECRAYQEKILSLHLREETQEKLMKEVQRLEKMAMTSPDAAVLRNYLDQCLALPWNKTTREKVDLESARRILDRDHFGMEKVKKRILEFLAVKKLAPERKGQVLCLVGPPGVGKTSIGISIAKTLHRKLARISLGGVGDEADIRGHRKTYIGAMPGRIITGIQQAGSRNPVLLLDEIDKLTSNARGDPAAALLEVLDFEQNNAFRDHFIEVPFDLSDVLFITTANTTGTIPPALLDRMEVIELSSYTDEEKLQIAKRHLIPKQLKKHGLKASVCRITDGAVREIISGYTRESGVRQLEREIAGVCRGAAARIVDRGEKRVQVTGSALEAFLGVRKYLPERRSSQSEVGVVCGLAWTSVGGELLEVEVSAIPGVGQGVLTGNLGDVMKESAQTALSFVRSRAETLGIEPDFYKKKDLHIHFPEGAVPKDGPSAGITTATAIVSALTDTPVRKDVAMTGEISLRGRVLPIGGLKEKTMAAYRNGIHTVLLPEENLRDLEEIDQTVRGAMRFITVSHMDQVLREALEWEKKPVRGERKITAPAALPPLEQAQPVPSALRQ